MTNENINKVVEANRRASELHDSVLAMHDELKRLVNPFISGSGFKGDQVLCGSADYLNSALAMLESAFCGFEVKCAESERLIRKEIDSNATQG